MRRRGARSPGWRRASTGALAGARAQARAAAWAAGAGPAGDEVVIDLDARLVTRKADKQDAAATYKRSYRHHPLLAMCVETSEVLAIILRPGTAGSNTAADHVVVPGAAVAQLPEAWRAGHEAGEGPAEATRSVLVRADAAGASHWFAEECRTATSATASASTSTTAFVTPYSWSRKRTGNLLSSPPGVAGPAAEVAELTDLVDLNAWPDGTRLVVRRERPIPAPS